MRPIAIVALLPFAAFAQTSTPEPAASPAPPAASASATPARWSLGAGVGFQTFNVGPSPYYVSSTLGGLYVSQPTIPTATASLERRLAPRTWLVLGVNGSYDRERQDLGPQSTGISKSDLYALALSAGIRQVLTRAGAPVDVSVDVLANAGATRWKGDGAFYSSVGPSPAPVGFEDSAWRAGATFGVAIDRELTGALSLRVATPIVGAWYARTETKLTGQPTQDGEELGAGLMLAPSLELRLAF